jgi:Protoglobin
MNIPIQISGEKEVALSVPPEFPDHAQVQLLLRIGLFSPDDELALRDAWRILEGQTDDYLDRVMGMVAAHPVLAAALTALCGEESATHSLDGAAAVRDCFRRWLFETCFFPHEPPWLKQLYLERVLPDSPVQSSPVLLPGFRHAVALAYPLVATARPFLAVQGRDHQDIERMQHALLKAILLQVTLLSKLYVKEGLW